VKIFTLGKSTFDSDLAEREALIEFNRQREKTPGQITKEAEELLKLKRRKQGVDGRANRPFSKF